MAKSGLEPFFLLLVCSSLLSFFIGGEVDFERFKLSFGVHWILTFYTIYFAMSTLESSQVYRLIYFFLICASATGLYGVVQGFTGIDFVRSEGLRNIGNGKLFRSIGFFGNSMTFGHSASLWFILSLVAFFQLLQKENKSVSNLWILALPLATFLGLLISFTRGAWFAVILSIFIVVLMNLKKVMVTLRKWMTIKNTLVSLFTVAMFVYLMSDVIWVASLRLIGPLSNFLSDSGIQSRLAIWSAHWAIFIDHPFFGIGQNNGPLVVGEYFAKLNIDKNLWHIGHAHNNFLQVLAELGLFGLGVYCLFFFKILQINLKELFRTSRDNPTFSILTVTLLAQLVLHIGGLTECNFEDSEVRNNFLFILSLLMYFRNGATFKIDSKGRELP